MARSDRHTHIHIHAHTRARTHTHTHTNTQVGSDVAAALVSMGVHVALGPGDFGLTHVYMLSIFMDRNQ